MFNTFLLSNKCGLKEMILLINRPEIPFDFYLEENQDLLFWLVSYCQQNNASCKPYHKAFKPRLWSYIDFLCFMIKMFLLSESG